MRLTPVGDLKPGQRFRLNGGIWTVGYVPDPASVCARTVEGRAVTLSLGEGVCVEALEPVEFITGEKVTVWGQEWTITSRTHHIDRGYYATLQRADADGYTLATLDIWEDDLRSAL